MWKKLILRQFAHNGTVLDAACSHQSGSTVGELQHAGKSWHQCRGAFAEHTLPKWWNLKLILQLDGCVTLTADQSIYVQQYREKGDEKCIETSATPPLPPRPNVKANQRSAARSLLNPIGRMKTLHLLYLQVGFPLVVFISRERISIWLLKDA